MYALRLPPELVGRLYRLREQHGRGSIRGQVLSAVERYIADAERELGSEAPPAPDPPSPAPDPSRKRAGPSLYPRRRA